MACGESATATPEPTEAPAVPDQRPHLPIPQSRAGNRPANDGAPTQRPSEPTPLPTAKPAATPVPTVAGATGPEGTLNTGFKEVNPFAAHPSLSSTIQAQFVGSGIGETPVSQDVNDVFQAELFSNWEVAEDGLTWTFTVRKGVHFHKGYGEMTAEDIVWYFEEFGSPESLNGHARHVRRLLLDAEGSPISKVDDYTVTASTSVPHFDMLLRLARPNIGAITSKRQAEELGDEGCTASTYSGPSAPRSRTGANTLTTETAGT